MKAQTTTAPSAPRITGQISRLLLEKGFGFILATEGEAADYFFHLSDLQNTVIADLTLGDLGDVRAGNLGEGERTAGTTGPTGRLK